MNSYELSTGLREVASALNKIAKSIASKDNVTYNIVVNIPQGLDPDEVAGTVTKAIKDR